MKKTLLLVVIIFLLFRIDVFSQRNDWLSLSLGGSFPVGEFASKNGNDPQSGTANPGGLIDLSYMHPLGKGGFGWTATLRGRLNPIDQSAAASTLAGEGYQWSGKTAYWKTAALMAGAYYQFPVAKRWQFSGSVQLGVADSRLPKYTTTGINSLNNSVLIQLSTNGVNALSFSALAKAGVTYQLTRRYSLLANIGFWDLKPTFKNTTVHEVMAFGFTVPGSYNLSNAESVVENSVPYVSNYKQPMNSLDISVGIGMRL